MKTSRKFFIVLSVLFSLFFVWYFFIKQSDYTISFKVKTATGTVFQGIQDWATVRSQSTTERYSTVEKKNFSVLKQEMIIGENSIEYVWNIEYVNDSISKVTVGIKEFGHSFYNKLTVPFISTKFKKEQVDKVIELKKGLEEHIKNFKIKIDGEGQSKETVVAYINLKSVLQEKAQTMITNDAIITGYLQQNGIKITGSPYLQINHWDLDKETLDFNYCFPIDKNAKYIESPVVKFKTIPAIKGLQATYYGNFRTSDRAWFALLDYAKAHNYKLDPKPLEHFLDNPFNGGVELEWRTIIVIPILDK